ncbi:MAG: hypothetical protein HYZ22_05225 [Chloroflexi bacterium]|nr:hypothetical protein [Chloroflexota bacterium]
MKLVLLYTLLAGAVAWGTSLIPGSSILLTLLELIMIIHLAKVNEYKLGLRDLFGFGSLIWAFSTALKDLVVELFFLVVWLDFGTSKVIVASGFVFLLGCILLIYFKYFGKDQKRNKAGA